jgi:protein SCO1/2
MRKGLIAAAALAVGLTGGALVWLWPEAPPQRSAAELMDVLMWDREPVGGSFRLIDHTGRARTDADFRGKLTLMYFGFTMCSEVCPTDLRAMAGALDKLGPLGDEVQPVFVTVDPERDSPAQLKRYVALVHPRLIGLTGEPAQIRRIADAYKVYYAKTEPTNQNSSGVDHTGFVFLLDANGKYIGFFPPGTSADRMVEIMRPQLVAMAR